MKRLIAAVALVIVSTTACNPEMGVSHFFPVPGLSHFFPSNDPAPQPED